jgi:hypothetical protein
LVALGVDMTCNGTAKNEDEQQMLHGFLVLLRQKSFASAAKKSLF